MQCVYDGQERSNPELSTCLKMIQTISKLKAKSANLISVLGKARAVKSWSLVPLAHFNGILNICEPSTNITGASPMDVYTYRPFFGKWSMLSWNVAKPSLHRVRLCLVNFKYLLYKLEHESLSRCCCYFTNTFLIIWIRLWITRRKQYASKFSKVASAVTCQRGA